MNVKKKVSKKLLFGILLCLLMLLGMLPAVAYADGYEDGDTCDYCGAYIWDDWVCGGVGWHCGPDSGNTDCWEEHHCTECGECYEEGDEYHCDECGRGGCCVPTEQRCETCGKCANCSDGKFCYGCNNCPDCRDTGDAICEYCGMCYDDTCGGMCSEGTEHLCAKDHDGYTCGECGKCILETGDYCTHCYRCEDCVGDDGKCSAWFDDSHHVCLDCHDDFDYCADCHYCWLDDIVDSAGKPLGCKECSRCADCVGNKICLYCGRCEDCVELCERCGYTCLECHDDDGKGCTNCGMCSKGVGRCTECGYCYDCTSRCSTCGLCITCGQDLGFHCADCGACIVRGGAELCDTCGLCRDCSVYCEECEECAEDNPDDHCSECLKHDEYDLCDCGICQECAGDEWCETCGLCYDCCDANDHCSKCHACLNDGAELCSACGLCEDCADEETLHCKDCGNCYEEYLYCEVCNLCIECIEEDNYCKTCYQCKEHHSNGKCRGSGYHTHKLGDNYLMDANYHWKVCRQCDAVANKVSHTLNSDKKCVICGYDAMAPIIITQQPKDVRARVSDVNALEDEPLCPNNNKVSFKVSATATQKGTLSYQWYYNYTSVLEANPELKYAHPLTDKDKTDDLAGKIIGATTSRLTIPVPSDACAQGDLVYFCKITLTSLKGEVLETIDSDMAALNCSHVYNDCEPKSEGSRVEIYFVSDGNLMHRGFYPDATKHWYACCGEECDEYKASTAALHNYGTPVTIKASTTSKNPDDFTEWYQYTCADCGYRHYVEKHVHNYEVPVPENAEDTDTMAFLEANVTAKTHPVRCTEAGCEDVRHEKHIYSIRRSYGYPETGSTGEYVLECQECEYTLGGTRLADLNNDRKWGGKNILVIAKDASVQIGKIGEKISEITALSLAQPSETVMLTPKVTGKEITKWKATYTDYIHKDDDGNYKTINVTLECTQVLNYWLFTMPNFYDKELGLSNGGELRLEPEYAKLLCTHTGTPITVNRVTQVCLTKGYTGDSVCRHCGKLIAVGDYIAAGTEHTGDKVLIESTVVEGSCTQRGYSGDYKCSDCGEIVEKGEYTGYKHGETELKNVVKATCVKAEYTGDACCKDCGAIVQPGKTLSLNEKNHNPKSLTAVSVIEPTCVKAGSTAAITCSDCGAIVKAATEIPALGHQWDEGTITTEATETENGVRTYHCTRTFGSSSTLPGSKTKARPITIKCHATKTEVIPAIGSTAIESVDLTVVAPVTGQTATAATTTATNCTIANTSWVDEDGKDLAIGSTFAGGKTYTVKVELEVASSNIFIPSTSFTVNGGKTTVVALGDEEVTLIYEFPETEKPTSSGGHSHGGGSSAGSTTSYTITVDKAGNGSITASAKSAAKGDEITLTVAPNKGYELDSLTVLDKNGDDIKLSEKSGKYTFTMPASKVTVKGSFKAETPEEKPTETPTETTGDTTFTDVPDGVYYVEAVKWAVKEGVTSGATASTFEPDTVCTRAQAVTLLWRAAGCPKPTASISFTDVPAGVYYAEAVAWAVENGITKGTTATTFGPNEGCTRAQIVTMLHRMHKTEASGTNPFTDVADNAYYRDAVLAAVAAGITTGATDTTFEPDSNCTRAQIVTFLFRAAK